MKVSIVIPTYNGEKHLGSLFLALKKQTYPIFEISIVDSGSRDKTVEIIRSFSTEFNIHLQQISNSEFSHGGTRNLGAGVCSGDIVVFTVQDAEPANEIWLAELVQPFIEDSRVACVYSRHIARAEASPMVARQLLECFAIINPRRQARVVQECMETSCDESNQPDVLWFNSNVCSAIRRDVLVRFPFPNIPYAEDQAMGRQLIEAGYRKVFSQNSLVIHSHQYPLISYFQRCFDEARGLAIATKQLGGITLSTLPLRILWNWVKDLRYIYRNTKSRKFCWMARALVFNTVSQMGFLVGKHFRGFSPRLQRFFSKEGAAYNRRGKRL